MYSNLRFQLERLGEEYIAELIKRLTQLDKIASGNLINSLDWEVIETTNKVILEIIGPDYLKWVDEGGRPGKMPPYDPIDRWVGQKGIQPRQGMTRNSLVWAIRKKIATEGIQPTNVLQKTEDSLFNRIQLLITLGLDKDIDVYISRI